MKTTENIEQFYQRVPRANALNLPLDNTGAGHINVFSREQCSIKAPYMRRDFYKVSLVIGTGKLQYANQYLLIDRPALLFSNPQIPYSWEITSQDQKGWFALFSESFLLNNERAGSLKESPLYRVGGNPVYFLNEAQLQEISRIFEKMYAEIQSDYPFKYDVVRNCLHLIIHEAMKMQPADTFQKHHNASERIVALFLELLERQFPVDSPDDPLAMTTANQYAEQLSVHVNHLNRVVKQHTEQTTTQHIAQRIVQEAWALLQHSDWSISEIAYSLGFDTPAYFTNFFKRKTGKNPLQARGSTNI
ncbi:AraC family transcriptional regulator [Flavobacterium sediminis]|uniref:AraC family transcriptional regulator n=1 Tax=Flavobacterium sediminis TaxID=2201181 RepID=A0A2U8QR99_9FLAO|nr:response regulator transcription factor [Flavobacterium sediminis]AWM12663.1 AraC family transcriptional regulator [Flavobacterium sediminis]